MSIPAIDLMKMEYMLYGGKSGLNTNCPSYVNGYRGGSGLNYGYNTGFGYQPSFRGGYSQDIFTAANDATRVNNQIKQMYEANPQVDYSNPQFRGLSDDLNELGDYYVKHSAPSESFMGAAVGGVTFGLINNPRTIIHPINSIKTTFNKDLNRMFADIHSTGDSALKTLYTNKAMYNGKEFKGGYELVSEAYARMHKLESLKNGKLGWFRRSLKKQPELLAKANAIKAEMEVALKAGNIEEIARLTEEAKRIGNSFTGFIPKGLKKWNWLHGKLTKLRSWINPTHYQEAEGVVAKNIAESSAKSTLMGSLKRSCGIGNGLFFAGFEFLNDFFLEKKIGKAFEKDSATGWTQILQTGVKGVGSALGWAVGEGIGAWAGGIAAMKAGSLLGTAIAPGVGTAIGAVAGLIGGSIGMWLMGKVTHAFIGDDVGTKAEVEKMKSTAQGQIELLQLTAQQAQDDKKLNQKTLNAINNVAQFYASQA